MQKIKQQEISVLRSLPFILQKVNISACSFTRGAVVGGICMSHWRILKKNDEFGHDFDKLVCECTNNLEHSCKKEKVLSTIT